MTTSAPVRKDETPAALYTHCVNVYEKMLQEARIEPSGDVVWEGMLVNFITGRMNLSVPYYTTITRALKRMGCIEQIKRGGGTAPSQWRLVTEPTLTKFEDTQPRRSNRKPIDKYEMLQDQLTQLSRRIVVLEAALEKVIQEEENKYGRR